MPGLESTLSTTSNTDVPSNVKFRYIKSNYFRVVHADGVFGGFTPQGNIFFSVFSERAPLPDVTFQAVEDGRLGKELIEHRQGGTDGVVRELEVGLTMNLTVAKSLADWLKERIEIAEKMQAELSVKEGAIKQ
jgi:hypothetical protein